MEPHGSGQSASTARCAAIVGVRARFGFISAAGEFAAGAHAADLRDAYGTQLDGVRSELDGARRSRAARSVGNAAVSPSARLPASASMTRATLTAGLMLGYHFGNYDGMRER